MPSLQPSIDVTIQATEQLQVGLDINLRDLGCELDVSVAALSTQPVPTDMALAAVPQLDAQLDMWVSIGGAASQLFQLDTDVTTPLIVGTHVLSDASVTASFSLVNLDEDVVSLQVGSSAVGVVSVQAFVNNGDGTGSFDATFDSAVASRYLTVVAVDDVANESAESPFHIVNSLERAKLNDLLSIGPQSTVSTPTCDRLLDAVPSSNFTLKRQYTVPYSFDATTFELRSVTPNTPIEIVVVRRGLPGEADETQRYVVIPRTEVELVRFRLGRGTNIVTAFDSYGRADTAIVAATTYASVLCSYAREIYNNSQVSVDEQTTAIYSPVSTRLAEPLLTFTDLLPDVRSQQTLAAKLAIRSLVADAGRQIGVRDILTALTLSTPVFVEQAPDQQFFEPRVRPMFNSQEAFAGIEAHVWLANACVQRWLAFINYLENAEAFDLLEVSENEVLFRDDTGRLVRHVFDLAAEECSLTTLALQALCFDTIDIGVTVYSESDFAICAAAYPFDLRPVPRYPVNPLSDEVGVELALDPGFDGYQDFSLTRHWDGGQPLDSQGPMPALGSPTPCVYQNGYLVSPLLLASANTTIFASPFISVVTSIDSPARSVDLDLHVGVNGLTVTAGLDVNVQLTTLVTNQRTAGCDMQVQGVQQVAVPLDVLISG